MILGAIAFPLYYLARRQGPLRLWQDLHHNAGGFTTTGLST